MQSLVEKIKKMNPSFKTPAKHTVDNYRSTSNIDYDNKMKSAGYQKAVLDFEKKNDLTKNHFTIGGPSANIV